MKLRFLGAATTVTGSQFLLTTDRARVLVECGMFQGLPSDVERNRIPLAYDPALLDAVLITHAHLDHSGYLPVVVREGFAGPIVLTGATAELASLILMDSAKIQTERSRRRGRRKSPRSGTSSHVSRPLEAGPKADAEAALRSQPAAVDLRDEAPLYDLDDVMVTTQRFEPVRYGEPTSVAPGVTATFEDAGHILGSAIIVLDIEESGETRRLVFSGDLGRPGTPIIDDPTAITGGADHVITESTYGGRHHGPAGQATAQLAEAVRETADQKGVLLIPAFAVGRTQEIVWHLDRMLSSNEIPFVPLYLDSPMASLATDIYRHHPGYYDDETRALLESGETPLDYPGAVVADTVRRSRAIATAPRPIDHRRFERHAHGRSRAQPSARAHRRSIDDAAVRGLSGTGHPGRASAGRCVEGATRRRRACGALPHPHHRRLLGARRRIRAAHVAGSLRPRGAPASTCLPRPWGPRGFCGARAQGPSAGHGALPTALA